MKLIFTFLICFLATVGMSQKNLVPNPGFEEVTGCPGPTKFLKNVVEWDMIDVHSGTPDQYYGDCKYNGIENKMAPGQKPHEGIGYVGSFCYGSNLREYITVKFHRPMVKDSIYHISFHVLPATGYGQAIDSYGVHFSEDKPQGESGKPLGIVALKEHVGNKRGDVLNDTISWTKISGEYRAKGGELYATFGNFRADEETRAEGIKENCIREDRSYMLLDEVVIHVMDEIICRPRGWKRDVIVKEEIIPVQKEITIELWDHMKVDGDTIDVWIDDELILENFALTNKMQKIELELDQGVHLFKIVAVNVGRIPPNTTTLRVRYDRNTSQFELNSDYDTTECLRIVIQ